MLRRAVPLRTKGKLSGVDLNDWRAFLPLLQTKGTYDPDKFRMPPVVPGPSDMFQSSLLRLPIPKLEDTCKRYLDCVQPIVPPQQFEATKKLVEEFQNGEGKTLHEELVAQDKRNKHTSYINEWWFDLYLRDRAPLPINYNPFLILRNERPPHTPPLEKMAYMVALLTKWYYQMRRNEIPPEVFFFGSPKHYAWQPSFTKWFQYAPSFCRTFLIMLASQFHVFPLDMSQFQSAFACTRIPQQGVDTLKRSGSEDITHIAVLYRGQQYRVNVCKDAASAYNVEQSAANVLKSFEAIVANNPKVAENDVSVLTSDNRDTWATARQSLIRDPQNLKSLEEIDRALLAISLDLDDEAPSTFTTSKEVNDLAKGFLAKPKDRWWDKSISLSITKTGTVGLSFEHSWGDGVAVLRCMVDLFGSYMHNIGKLKERKVQPDAGSKWEQLTFKLDQPLKNQIALSKKRIQGDLNNTDFYILVYPKFGKGDKIFKTEMKPDPFVQVAFQLAWWRLKKSTVSTYESASTAAFLHGRTECIRSATNESQAFTVGMDNSSLSSTDKYAKLVKAVEKHAAISKDAKMGQGVDRHLFGLRKLAEAKSKKLPIFEDPSYKTLGSNMLSTSTLFSEALMTGGFGPVSPGYGIGYGVADDLIMVVLSCWKNGGPGTTCEDYADALYSALDDMYALAQKEGKVPKKE